MFTFKAKTPSHDQASTHVLIPVIRTAATIGFAIAPCSLGFVIIAMSEHLIRSIMVGDDAEMLVSQLQVQYPHDVITVDEHYAVGLVGKVVDLIDRPAEAAQLPLDVVGGDFQARVWDAMHKVPSGTAANDTFLAEQLDG